MDALQVEKRGYLLERFRLFHLDTALTEDTAFHFHDFHKIVFFLDGSRVLFDLLRGFPEVVLRDELLIVELLRSFLVFLFKKWHLTAPI